jgi:glycerol-3-phosphate dehydrogenase
VTSLLLEGGTVQGAMVTDAETGRSVAARARVVVNATGPWTDTIHRHEIPDAPPMVRGTKGVHITVPRHRVDNREAITLLSEVDGRVMFVLPAGEHAIIGTTDTETSAPPEEVRADERDIAYLLAAVNRFFPGARLGRGDVVSAWAGIRPLIASGFDATPASASREHQLSWTPGGVLAMSGGKLTTYRTMAAEAVDAIAQRLGRPPVKSPTLDRPLPGGDIASLADVVAAATTRIGSASRAVHLVHSYGSQWKEVWMLAEDDPSLGDELVPGLPYIRAEVVYAVAREAARALGDVLIRRTKVAFETRDQGRGAADDASGLVAPLLKWSEERRRSALLDYEREVTRMFAVDPDPGPGAAAS